MKIILNFFLYITYHNQKCFYMFVHYEAKIYWLLYEYELYYVLYEINFFLFVKLYVIKIKLENAFFYFFLNMLTNNLQKKIINK